MLNKFDLDESTTGQERLACSGEYGKELWVPKMGRMT
jgi:hypothetical protein